MNQEQIIIELNGAYTRFNQFINSLTEPELLFSYEHKWNALQQLQHIVLCVAPLVHLSGMPAETIAQQFGRVSKEGRSYDTLLQEYVEKLAEGGKAPERFLPEIVSPDQKISLNNKLAGMIQELVKRIGNFNEQELDTLAIPHPLLGVLSFREMLYNAIYHVQHHQALAAIYLSKK